MPRFTQRLFVVLTCGLLFGGVSVAAQKYVDGQVIVQFPSSMSEKEVRESLKDSMFYVADTLIPSKGYYLLKSKVNMTVPQAEAVLNRTDSVVSVQKDYYVTLRNTPNDKDFAKQWALNNKQKSHIGALEAWKYGTGGKDRSGNDIVIAIVDGGVDTRHPDLQANLWVNTGEKPGNMTDDDGNGYIDDIHGWNAFDDDGTIPANYHGTHVAGITGAKGNNGKQVAGVNWNVKIMAVAAASNRTSVVMKGYNYILKQKQLFLDTNGAKGANVVVTNNSFGIDYADCTSSQYQVWNDMYDALGAVGILSAAAAPNNHVNVDEVGDVPTGCPSDYIVSVTNTTEDNEKYARAGYGATQVDLGAPGTKILSTLPGNTVGANTGTSMATPHVAGAVAFLHSVAGAQLHSQMISDPAKGALLIKNVLLNNVDEIPDLKGDTVSGGRLHLGKAASALTKMNRFIFE